MAMDVMTMNEVNPELLDVLASFKDLFPHGLPSQLPPSQLVDHTIPLVSDVEPPSPLIYCMSFMELEELHKQLDDLLAKG